MSLHKQVAESPNFLQFSKSQSLLHSCMRVPEQDADPECQPNYSPNEEKTKVREMCQIIETNTLKALHFLGRCSYC
jgi:hypothetical protein